MLSNLRIVVVTKNIHIAWRDTEFSCLDSFFTEIISVYWGTNMCQGSNICQIVKLHDALLWSYMPSKS